MITNSESATTPVLPELFGIASIDSPGLLTLNTGLRIRLLGIRRNEDKALEAMEFLRRMLEGQLVFMKHDKVKTDHLGTELVYLYLENGSFLNALLVKYDLVDVEDTIPFKYKERFQKRQADNRAPK